MRRVTVVVLLAVLVALSGTVFLAVGSDDGGQLTEKWVSDTARESTFNHHPMAVGPNGSTIVAPVTAVPGVDEMTTESCSLVRLGTVDGAVQWRQTIPPDSCFSHALTQPAIGDLDGDGSLETAVANTKEQLVVSEAASGDRLFSANLSTYGYGQPAIADLTGSPGAEVVVSDIEGTVVAVSSTGEELWRHELGNITWASPIVADVDGDGAQEVLVGTNSRTVLLDETGSIEWSRPGTADTIAVGQADSDDALEVFTTATERLVSLDGKTGTEEWQASFEGNPRVKSVVDGDGDGQVEVYASLTTQTVVAVNGRTGVTEWETTMTTGREEFMAAPRVGDVDGDGTLEVIATAYDGTVAVLDPASGDEIASYEREMAILTYAVVADIDDDAAEEILVKYADGRVIALDFEQ